MNTCPNCMTVFESDNWISVEDELPDILESRSKSALVLRDCGEGTLQSQYVTFRWADHIMTCEQWNDQESLGYRVAHWQPLPPPPKNTDTNTGN